MEVSPRLGDLLIDQGFITHDHLDDCISPPFPFHTQHLNPSSSINVILFFNHYVAHLITIASPYFIRRPYRAALPI